MFVGQPRIKVYVSGIILLPATEQGSSYKKNLKGSLDVCLARSYAVGAG